MTFLTACSKPAVGNTFGKKPHLSESRTVSETRGKINTCSDGSFLRKTFSYVRVKVLNYSIARDHIVVSVLFVFLTRICNTAQITTSTTLLVAFKKLNFKFSYATNYINNGLNVLWKL